ncbi:tubulin glycylase 3B-like [Teleopsis dalmanni]|uniref:tubulin glycylase 3B-like n=1 Tax=Teleopsis dalmanni TaxID=139649 RepID=UPI0018CCF701|nr:tubulin glycylase 3B-like [Teleopsis dalmanni]
MDQKCNLPENETEFSKNMKELQSLLADVNKELAPLCKKCAVKKSSQCSAIDKIDEKPHSTSTETGARLIAGDNKKKFNGTIQNNRKVFSNQLGSTESKNVAEKSKIDVPMETKSELELSKSSQSDLYEYIDLPSTSRAAKHKEEKKIFQKKSPLNLLNSSYQLTNLRRDKYVELKLISSTTSFEERLNQIYSKQKEDEIYNLPILSYKAYTNMINISEKKVEEKEEDSVTIAKLILQNKFFRQTTEEPEEIVKEVPDKLELRVGPFKTIDHEKLRNINENIERRWTTMLSPQARLRKSLLNLYRKDQDREHKKRKTVRKQRKLEGGQDGQNGQYVKRNPLRLERKQSTQKLQLIDLYIRNDKKKIQSVVEAKTQRENQFKQMIEKYFSKHVPLKDLETNFDSDYFHGRFVDTFDTDVYSGSDYDSEDDDNGSFDELSSDTNIGSAFSITGLSDPAATQRLTDLHNEYIERATKAHEKGQIFFIHGHFTALRKEFHRRGWLEKLPEHRFSSLQDLPDAVLLYNARKGNNYEIVMISRVLAKYPPVFIWQPKFITDITIKSIGDVVNGSYPHRNRVYRGYDTDFTSKVGLIGCTKEDTCDNDRYPRVYRICDSQREQELFVKDFRRTQCRSLLRYLCKHFTNSQKVIDEKVGTIPASVAYFALEVFKEEYFTGTNNVNEKKGSIFEKKTNDQWNDFILSSNNVIHSKCKLKMNLPMLNDVVNIVKPCLRSLEENTRNIKWEGHKNIWLLKPGFRCRGMGILLTRDVEYVLRVVNARNSQSYIVQKYIERPLLIYNTKFDIRMYFIYRIEAEFISVWLYDDFYLRFSSQTFSLNDLRESVHLTNNSVQKKYSNSTTRDKRLPPCNMWGQVEFLKYLDSQGKYDLWKRQIIPRIRAIIVSIVTASLKETDLIPNTYELFGCDFMLDQDYFPILIEINSSPDLTHSTHVTAAVCPKVLTDLVKVVVDYPSKKQNGAPFNLIHRFHYD